MSQRLVGTFVDLTGQEAKDIMGVLKKHGEVYEVRRGGMFMTPDPYLFDLVISTPEKDYFVKFKTNYIIVEHPKDLLRLVETFKKFFDVREWKKSKGANQAKDEPDLILVNNSGLKFAVYFTPNTSQQTP